MRTIEFLFKCSFFLGVLLLSASGAEDVKTENAKVESTDAEAKEFVFTRSEAGLQAYESLKNNSNLSYRDSRVPAEHHCPDCFGGFLRSCGNCEDAWLTECDSCQGNGYTEKTECDACGGKGGSMQTKRFRDPANRNQIMQSRILVKCSKCDGRKYIYTPCTKCKPDFLRDQTVSRVAEHATVTNLGMANLFVQIVARPWLIAAEEWFITPPENPSFCFTISSASELGLARNMKIETGIIILIRMLG